MRKLFLSVLALLLLSAFFILPVAAQNDQPPTGVEGKDYYFTKLTDHNPPTMTVTFFPPGTSPPLSPERAGSTHTRMTADRAISVVADAKAKPLYTPHQMTLQFYTYKGGKFKRLKPADIFVLGSGSGTATAAKLTKPLETAGGQPPAPGDAASATFTFQLKTSVPLPTHLTIVASLNYVPPGGGPLVLKGPVFTTLLLEPQE